MLEEEFDDMCKLIGEDFYNDVEQRYGKNVARILKYHDIDSYFILGPINENELIDVFEKTNDENCSDELIALKKEICTFIGDKVSIKVGTKGKLLVLLYEIKNSYQRKQARTLLEKKANRFNKSRSSSASTNSDENGDINLKESYKYVRQSITTLLISAKQYIHGVTVTDVSANDFKIDIQFNNDNNLPTCNIECICGDRINLYYRNNRFQASNLSKHFKSTYLKSTFMINNKIRENDNSEILNDMVLVDKNLEKEDTSSLMDIDNDKYLSVDDDASFDSTPVPNAQTSNHQQRSQNESNSSDNDSDTLTNERINLNRGRRSSRILPKTGETESSITFDTQPKSKKQLTTDELVLRPSSLPPTIRSIKTSKKQNEVRVDFSNTKKQKLTDDHKQIRNKSSVRNTKATDQNHVHNQTGDTDILPALLQTIKDNSHRPPNNYKYPPCVFRFASAISILAGRYVYEYLRMNLKFLLPTLQTIQNNSLGTPYAEANFRFHESVTDLISNQCQYVFLSEDCSSIIPRIEYDASLDVFNGFTTPVIEGVPIENAFRCTSFEQLKDLFETTPRAKLVNIHVIQPIPNDNVTTIPPPRVLAAYGTDNQLTAVDILQRWITIYKKFFSNGIRVLGYSTDGDPKYLRSMRLAANFFVKNEILNIYNDKISFKIQIPPSWSSWFFLSPNQLFLFLQDGVHICTKMRNRLLSKSTELIMGTYRVSMGHLYDLIESINKIDHNLSISDLNVKDRQNFSSCQKISDDKVLNLLLSDEKYKGTYNYLLMLNLLITAYTERCISIHERIYYAWIVLLYVRLWRIWLYVTKSTRRNKLPTKTKYKNRDQLSYYFISYNALMCIELNAHYLIYVYLLIEQQIVPPSIANNIHLFSSQHCENVFRNARSLSGVFSTRINFTIRQFLKRIHKLNTLEELKQFEISNNEHKIVFPIHHKIKRHIFQTNSNVNDNNTNFNIKCIEEIILEAYKVAKQMADYVGMSIDLIKNNIFDIDSSSELTKHLLKSNTLTESKLLDVDGRSDDESSDDEENDQSNKDDEEELLDIMYDDPSDDDLTPTSTFENLRTTTYSGADKEFYRHQDFFFRFKAYNKDDHCLS